MFRRPLPLTPNARSAGWLACFLLTCCAVGPDYKRPSASAPVSYKEAANPVYGPSKPIYRPVQLMQKAEPADEDSRGPWWRIFNDPALDALEAQVAVNNQNVRASEAAFRQARALVAEARSGYFPTVGASGTLTRSGSGTSRSGRSSTLANEPVISSGANTITTTGVSSTAEIANNYDVSAQASWVPDLWGGIRRQVESSKAGAQASAADLASATLSAQAQLAIDYLSLRIADEQARTLKRSSEAFAKSLRITENQYKAGVTARSDVLLAKVQLETTQAQAVDVQATRAVYEHAIAVLIGKNPADFTLLTVNYIPALPWVPVTLPSELLQRRPDIAASERRVAAANAQIGVAEAAFFPSLTLSASGGYSSSQIAQLFTMPSRFWSIGPSLAETLFDAGLRAAQTEAAIAAYDQSVATYRQTVLNAFQGVEDNLAQLRIYAGEADVLDGAVKDARDEVTITLNQYKAGTVNYLNVTSAQTSELNNELTALNLRRLRLVAAATLVENLGGSWEGGKLDKPEITQGETGPWSLLPPSLKGHQP